MIARSFMSSASSSNLFQTLDGDIHTCGVGCLPNGLSPIENGTDVDGGSPTWNTNGYFVNSRRAFNKSRRKVHTCWSPLDWYMHRAHMVRTFWPIWSVQTEGYIHTIWLIMPWNSRLYKLLGSKKLEGSLK